MLFFTHLPPRINCEPTTETNGAGADAAFERGSTSLFETVRVGSHFVAATGLKRAARAVKAANLMA